MRFPDHNLRFRIACFERGTQVIFDLPKGDLHCQERDAYFTMDLTSQMCQKGWKLMGKMMCSCSELCFKNLVYCVVSQLADFSN